MSTAIGNFMSWSERHQARRDHDRLDTEHDAEEDAPPRAEISSREAMDADPEAPAADEEGGGGAPAVETVLEEGDEETGVRAEVTEEGEEQVVPPSDTAEGVIRRRQTVSLEELEEERELARRRTSACILLSVFILFRLWVEALAEGDFGLLLLCLVGTSWTARFIRHNREREEELDRRIAAYVENAENGTTEVNRSDLRMLSFQAQLALAIMESQRVMVQGGGFGHPDGHHGRNQGVSDQAKEHWERYQFKSNDALNPKSTKTGYGSLAQEDEKTATEDEAANCSICLCEYEDGDRIARLPCSHEYHDECVSSWTSNHVRCPLCNFDLETATDAQTVTTIASSQAPPEDSIV
jgi:hypothetical protein